MSPFEAMKFADLEEMPRKATKKAMPKRGPNPQPKSKVVTWKAPPPDGIVAEPRAANWKVPAYRHNPAMRDALERARQVQGPMVSINNSPVRSDNE